MPSARRGDAGDVDRLDAEVVPGEGEPLLLPVPERQPEHPVQPVEGAGPPLRERLEHDLGVGVGPEAAAEGFELPGADLSGEEMSVRVIPRQADEFTCSRCFLVHHRSQLAAEKNGQMICSECAA